MRRGTVAAEIFGKLLHDLRVEEKLTMRQVGAIIDAPAATVSQVEKAQRAVKEDKLSVWAKALKVDLKWLRKEWLAIDKNHPAPPVHRGGRRAIQPKTLESLISQLNAVNRTRVFGYVEAIIEQQ